MGSFGPNNRENGVTIRPIYTVFGPSLLGSM